MEAEEAREPRKAGNLEVWNGVETDLSLRASTWSEALLAHFSLLPPEL